MPKDEDFVFFWNGVFKFFFAQMEAVDIAHWFFFVEVFRNFYCNSEKNMLLFFCDVLYRQPPFEQKNQK